MSPQTKQQVASSIVFSVLGIWMISLCSCAAIPTVNDSVLIVQVTARSEATDAQNGEEIIDEFARREGYIERAKVDLESKAGNGYIKAFGYSGTLQTLRAYELPITSDKSLPYLIDLLKGAKGQLFFDITLGDEHHRDNSALKTFLDTITSSFGRSRTRVANPSTVDWLLMGD